MESLVELLFFRIKAKQSEVSDCHAENETEEVLAKSCQTLKTLTCPLLGFDAMVIGRLNPKRSTVLLPIDGRKKECVRTTLAKLIH